MEINTIVLDRLADALNKAGYLIVRSEFNELASKIQSQAKSRGNYDSASSDAFSISRAIRGATAAAGHVVRSDSAADDVAYFKRTLLTGTTPGSFLVPTIQADQIVQLLTSANVVREAGARIWPMHGIQKLNVPVATASPAIVWGNSAGQGTGGQGTTQTPSDPNLSQMAFDLKSAKALTAIPNELLATSVPAVDQIVSEILGLAFAQAEINAMLATTTGTGMPVPLYAASGTTVINANGGSANGGAVTLTDLLSVLSQFFAQKGKGTPAWFMHPTVFYRDVLGIKDSSGRPIVTGFDSLEGAFSGYLFGYKVYVSAEFPVNQSVGSGSNQSYVCFTNPTYLNIGDSGGLELAVSFERFFDSNETAIRGVRRVDFGYAPAQAIILLAGVNV
jgi:HK97 family phage major capsid protein